MNKRNLSIIIILLVFCAIVSAQSGFEGTIEYKIDEKGNESNMSYSVKGESIRIDVKSDEEVTIIFNNDKILFIMPSQKMYMEYPKSMMEKMIKNVMGNDDKAEKETVDILKYKTSETADILGYTCSKWSYPNDSGISEVWATEELGNFMFFKNPMESGNSNVFDFFNNTAFFPLKIISKDSEGNKSVNFEAVGIVKKQLNESDFTAPADYRKMDIPGNME